MRPPLPVLSLLLLLAGCAAPPPPATAGTPADFAMSLLHDDGTERWLCHLYPDRTLHAATGDGVNLDTYTPRTARLSPAATDTTYRLLRALIAATPASPADPPSPTPTPPPTLTCRWTAHGQAGRLTLLGPPGPEATALLNHLRTLRHPPQP